jgi:hypothetical protein
MANKCDFMTSHFAVTESHCEQMKKQFQELPFKPEVTLAASQCMPFSNKERLHT